VISLTTLTSSLATFLLAAAEAVRTFPIWLAWKLAVDLNQLDDEIFRLSSLTSVDRARLLQQLLSGSEDKEARAAIDNIGTRVDNLTTSVDALAQSVIASAPTVRIDTIESLANTVAGDVHQVKSVVDTMNQRVLDAEAKLATVDSLLAAVSGNASNKQWQARASIAVAAQGNPVLAKLAARYQPGVNNESIVALCSPPGFGKSYLIRTLGRAYDCYLEHGCSPDAEEIQIMLGCPTVRQDGSVLVVDGVLTQAVCCYSLSCFLCVLFLCCLCCGVSGFPGTLTAATLVIDD